MPTMLEDPVDHVELNSRQEALERRVLLLCPTIGWWKGMYQLPRGNTDVMSDGETVDKDDITTPRAKLVTDTYPLDAAGVPWKRRFQKIESRLKALKERYSVPFPIQGVRIVPKARGQEMMDEMYGMTLGRLRRKAERFREEGDYASAISIEHQIDRVLRMEGESADQNTPVFDTTKGSDAQSIAYDLHVAAKEFCANWDNIRDQIRRHNKVFEQVQSKVPTNAGVMRAKFNLDVVPVELAGGLTRPEALTQDDLAEHDAVVREACRRRVEEAIEEMIVGPRQQLAETLANLKDLIARDGNVSAKSFKPIYAAIAKVRSFDFVANEDLLAQITALETRLNTTQPNSLDSVTAANNGFSAAIDAFMAEVQDAQKQGADLEAFGKEFRSIDIG